MIDTLKIRLSDYELSSNNDFILFPATCKTSGDIVTEFKLTKIDNDFISGSKIVLNNDLFNCTISGQYTDAADNCIVQMSLPKFYSKADNLNSLNYEQTQETFNNLQKELLNCGIKTNLETAKIMRLDTFKNIETDEKFSYYANFFNELVVSRKQKRDYGTSKLFYNSGSQICIYDKIEEMVFKDKQHKTNYSEAYINSNVIRFENRLLRQRKVLSELEFNDFKTLKTKEGFQKVTDNYYSTMKSSVFKLKTKSDIEFKSKESLLNELLYFKNTFNRNWKNEYLKFKGLENIKKEVKFETFIEAIQQLLKGSSNESLRKTKHDLKKLWYDSLLTESLLKINESTNITLYSLYKELETKMFLKVS